MGCEHAQAAGGQTSPSQFEENTLSEVKRVIAVLSGKGGVGKSFVTGAIATELARHGHKVGVLDADITGPSIPKMFGMSGRHVHALGNLMLPEISEHGVKVMSSNLLLQNETDPVLWRGPVIAGAIRQFWSETSWGPIDYLLVDMPPGTGDVALTVFQSLPVDGIVIVTSPQDLVSMIVAKAVNMAEKMNVPILGIVENMSYIECPDCGKKIEVFGRASSPRSQSAITSTSWASFPLIRHSPRPAIRARSRPRCPMACCPRQSLPSRLLPRTRPTRPK